MPSAIQITTTTERKLDAQRIAAALVEARLAACVQISGPMTSHYRWKDQVETADEWLCTIKTTQEVYAPVEQKIRELHPYDEPEIIATAIVTGSSGYLEWLFENVTHA